MSMTANVYWFGITGTWNTTLAEVRDCVVKEIEEIFSEPGRGIVTGGALGVDYYAVEAAIALDPGAERIRVVIPSTLEEYCRHLELWSRGYDTGDPGITLAQKDMLIDQLSTLKTTNDQSIIECSRISAEYIDQTAYYARNSVVVELSDEIIAFQVSKSKGTQDTIQKAIAHGKRVKLLPFSE